MTNTDTVSDSLNRFNLVTSDHNRGFTMTFSNRVTVSVRWGKYNYSDGKTTAEVAARDADTDESHDERGREVCPCGSNHAFSNEGKLLRRFPCTKQKPTFFFVSKCEIQMVQYADHEARWSF